MLSKKTSDQLVEAKAILEAITELKRRGIDPIMQELESMEPDLASHVMEELSLIHKTLIGCAIKSKSIRRLMVQVETLVLISILSLRKAQHQLWQDDPEVEPHTECKQSPPGPSEPI